MISFRKQPSEARWVSVDFADGLQNAVTPLTPDTISSYTIVVVDEATGASAAVLGAGAASGGFVFFLAQAGTDARTYKFTVVMTTSSGQICEQDVRMKVKAR